MTKPSLFAILSNKPVIRPRPDGASFVEPVRDPVIKRIQDALDHHEVKVLSKIGYFTDNLIKESEITAIIEQEFLTSLSRGENSEDPIEYKAFKDTPLFKRLEDIKHGKLTLYGILDPRNNISEVKMIDTVLGEIRDAVACGFREDLLQYQIGGISAYPDIARIPIAPLNQGGIIALKMDPAAVTYILVNSKLSQLKSRFNLSIKELKDFFSHCLTKASTLEDVEICIKYIVAYQNTGGGVSLAGVLNYHLDDIPDNNLFILYKQYNALLLEIPTLKKVILQLIKDCSNSMVQISHVYNIATLQKIGSILDIICKLNIMHGNLPLCQKLFLTPYSHHTICFIKIFESNPELFSNLIKMMPWESGLKKLLYSNFCLEDYQVIHHILMHEKCVEIFQMIAKHCNIELLVALAHLQITRWGDPVQISICDELADAGFCCIVFSRMQKEGKLSQIQRDTIMEYCLCIFDQDPVVAIVYALQQRNIKSLLEENILVPEIQDETSIGEYIFSGRYKGGKTILDMIYQDGVLTPIEFIELVHAGRAFDNESDHGSNEGLHDPVPMPASSAYEKEPKIVVIGGDESLGEFSVGEGSAG